MKYYFCCLLICTGICAYAQNSGWDNSQKIYDAGYDNIIVTDSGRLYKSGTSLGDPLHFRPLEIDLWYPALHGSSDSPMAYGPFVNLLQERSNRFQNDTVFTTLSSELVQYFAAHLNLPDTAILSHVKTRSYRYSIPVKQKFPLLLYMCAFNGMSYENVKLFEWLASHGYVVACITSVGRYPGNMTTKMNDIMEQVMDGEFAKKLLKHRPDVDSSKTGILGYSWGGLAALISAVKNPEITAVLSLDGSEMHYYGESEEEDSDFNSLRSSSVFGLKDIHVPYAYLESGSKQDDRAVDSIFNPVSRISGTTTYMRFQRAEHETFSCLSSILFSESRNNKTDDYKIICQLALNYFDQYLKGSNRLFSQQVALLVNEQVTDSIYRIAKPAQKNDLSFIGIAYDSKDLSPLSYVNIGIPNKNTGTVSQRDGHFKIDLSSDFAADSILFSIIGYQAVAFKISDLLKQSRPLHVYLNPAPADLKEVTITGKLPRIKTMGNTTESKFISVGLPLKFLGSEIGIRINLGTRPVLLERFHFTVSDTRLDTSVFRLNIYRFKNGSPGENMLRKNILISLGKNKGKYNIDLSEYKLYMKGEILLSIEWLAGSSSQHSAPGAMFLSAGFLNAATWHRLTSQGEWKKASGLGVGFNLDVQTLQSKN